MAEAALQAQGLRKAYGDLEALAPLDRTLPAGGALAVQGPNGAGKSTLLGLAAGLLHPTAGSVRLFGRPAREPAARQRLGFVPESPRWPARSRVGGLVRLAARLSGLDRTPASRRTEAILDRLGLADRASHRVGTLSRGLRQRLALAQALVHGPDLLVLDEPLTHLDAPSRAQVIAALHAAHDDGAALLVATHWPEAWGDLLPDALHLPEAR